ncbi:Flagellin C [Methylocella tundrae]|jgi:flagellin|uniref:Flagellin n=1 Tax=Methylocella tundrae TaxID=227605 RepID=A0A4U8YZ72_METTU|nr:flagellin [Methylocella tundrae]WPP04731.1 flagellin [Methylocella tundrae]VFU06931.1 Flagellin C [Methylocella tundrae]VTZ27104.1 Flagellin C [Methylocella tundrae]VTZ50039.1 Flagellin C [Methylocella tundrae]
MSSLLTNTSAMTALASLTQTQNNLSKTESQISTGLRISSASDNPAYWSIATKMSSNVGALGAVNDALSESSALVSTMSSALNSTISVVTAIKNDLTTASNAGADLSKIQTDIAAQQASLLSIGSSANFNGLNFLETTGGTVNLVASYDSTNGVSFLSVDTSQTALFNATTGATTGILGASGANYTTASILSLNITTATAGDLSNMLKDVEKAISSITTAASTLGATTTNLSTQQTYISNLSDSLTTGVGSLVDANMNEAATKLAALQVQQQLGIQALSISNSNSQLILKLFQ